MLLLVRLSITVIMSKHDIAHEFEYNINVYKRMYAYV